MTNDYKRGPTTGLAMEPLDVTTGADIVKFGTHNLLTDSGVTFGSAYTDFAVSGEVCTCTVKSCALDINTWCNAVGGLNFKSGYMYKLAASKFNGYGRLGISNVPGSSPFANVGCNAYGNFFYNSGSPSHGDNTVITPDWLVSQFYIGHNSAGHTIESTTGEIWLCTDWLYNGTKATHSFEISLFEEVKS